MFESKANSRHELDVNLMLVLAITIMITFSTYLIVLPVKDSYIGILLYSRGFTQYIAVLFASFVVGTVINKYSKIQTEFKILRRMYDLPNHINFKNHRSSELSHLQQDFSKRKTMVTSRVSRLIGAYTNSGSRKVCSEFALDESAFYITASESSYTIPRILVWAIPLLGFIGTVLGISSAVNGFSGFLNNAAEIDKIKEGIGTVTTGLAIAFDTTLLALLLSVMVMIPLVFIERLESKLLLSTDVFINDDLLPHFIEQEETKFTPILSVEGIQKTIVDTLEAKLPSKLDLIKPIKEALPTPQELIKPAELYAQEAANKLAEQFVSSFTEIQQKESELIEGLKNINKLILADRNHFIATYQEQQNLNRAIIKEIQDIVALVSRNSETFSQGFNTQTQAITAELNKASQSLNQKVATLEQISHKIAGLNNLSPTLDNLVRALDHSRDMQETLNSIKESIINIKPTLKDLGKPRVIRLVEQIEKE